MGATEKSGKGCAIRGNSIFLPIMRAGVGRLEHGHLERTKSKGDIE